MPGHLLDMHANGGFSGVTSEDSEFEGLSNTYGEATATSMSTHVFCVVLVDDRTAVNISSGVASNFHILGVILLDSLNIVVEELRRIMYTQLPSLPGTFNILTKQGWPLHPKQESKLYIGHIINENDIIMIRKHFDRPRVGVQSTSGEFIGFVFIEPECKISQVREAINDQLKDNRRQEYRFLERNGWPVALHQESLLSILDIIRLGYHICIQYFDRISLSPPTELPASTSLPLLPQQFKKKTDGNSGIVQRTMTKLESLRKKKEYLVAKPILISYVRAEAAEHALNLKEELANAGFSVYLDVHEIKTGSDWQDALNYAVSNCQFFVPLITPMYGKTQWTNREVKLADALEKVIIPISFLDHWPPECLAIQFASTQYIPWKPQEGDHACPEGDPKSSDIRVWDPVHIKRVCIEIAERCKSAPKKAIENDLYTPSANPTRRKLKGSSIKRCEFQNSVDNGPKVSFRTNLERKLVVISAHPKQKLLVHQLRIILEAEGYDVWCSSDLQDTQELALEETLSSNPNTPRELMVIPEGNTVFGQAYNEIANIIADSKRGSSIKTESDGHTERKPLTRMISQVSDISQVSSLTPDKLERLKAFQQKADQAGVVVIVVSEAYTKSKTSQQQVFYCEHRKQVVLVRFDQNPLPSWFTMLMGSDMITNVHCPQFITTLKAQVKRALNPSSTETPKDATAEAKIQCFVNFMKKEIPRPETCVYIAGSSKLLCPRSEDIAKAIGRELAKIQNITVCTGGFHGAPEIVARAFSESLENNAVSPGFSSGDAVVHVLPRRDSKDFTTKAHQNPDGSFEAVSFGKTVFVGDSVKDRETAVARLFDTCIVIEGGPGAAHEVEEFIWNDHFVIPIISTGGAAGGQYGVPLKIFEAPPCVSENDWLFLSEKEAKPEAVARAVVNIVLALKQSIVTHISSQTSQPFELSKFKNKTRNRSKKSKAVKDNTQQNKTLHVSKKDEIVQTQEFDAICNGVHSHRPLRRQTASYNACSNYRHSSRWQRFLQIFSAAKIR